MPRTHGVLKAATSGDALFCQRNFYQHLLSAWASVYWKSWTTRSSCGSCSRSTSTHHLRELSFPTLADAAPGRPITGMDDHLR
jgi:hypothetical protein